MSNNKGKTAAANRPRIDDTTDHSDIEPLGRPSSPELGTALSPRRLGLHQDYSGHDITSYSEWSDGPSSNPSIPLRSKPSIHKLPAGASGQSPPSRDTTRGNEPGVLRDPERVVCNGYLQCLRIKGGVRQWKRLWVVLRPKSLGFYKDEQVRTSPELQPPLSLSAWFMLFRLFLLPGPKNTPTNQIPFNRNTLPSRSSPCPR